MLLDDALARTATPSAFVRLHDIIARVPGLIGTAGATGGATGNPAGQIAPDRASVSTVERCRAVRRRVDGEHARLLAQAQQALAEAREAQRRMAFLANASALLASALDYDPILTTITSLVVPRLADWCCLAIVNEDGAIHRCSLAHLDPAQMGVLHEMERRFPLDPTAQTRVAQVLQTGRALLHPEIPDAVLDASARTPEHLELLRRLRLQSALDVPLVAAGRTLGVLLLATAESGRRYGPSDLAMAVDLAHHAALAIDRARLYREAQEARDAAEAALRARAEFLSAATHDLRVPLTTTMGRAHMVQLSLQAQDSVDQIWLRRQLDALCAAGKRMLAAVDEVNDVAGLQMGRALDLHLEPVDVGMVLSSVADDAIIGHGSRVVEVEAPVGAMMMGDRARLERVMHNVVGNALKYSTDCTPVRVEVSQDEAWVTVTVRDRGVGIPAADVPHVFTLFYRASTARGVPGRGIGLAGARTIVEQHGGQITVQSTVGEGTTVIITLPRRTGALPMQ
jgi:signal transduction histidine kinase